MKWLMWVAGGTPQAFEGTEAEAGAEVGRLANAEGKPVAMWALHCTASPGVRGKPSVVLANPVVTK